MPEHKAKNTFNAPKSHTFTVSDCFPSPESVVLHVSSVWSTEEVGKISSSVIAAVFNDPTKLNL